MNKELLEEVVKDFVPGNSKILEDEYGWVVHTDKTTVESTSTKALCGYSDFESMGITNGTLVFYFNK